ncbi:MAG: outer membrane protein [Mucilaginibacter sp.]|nr:outer membrane protein [Mucilaginibacter sp.]
MKKLFKVALVAVGILMMGNFAKAQTKVGYINFQSLISQMPEAKTVKTQLDTYSKQFTDQLAVMQNELQTKGKDFQAKSATMTDAVRSSKQTELQDLQNRLQNYNTTAQQKFEERSNELIKPLTDKARAALTAVAKEKGYTYVLDSSQVQLLVSPEGDDLMTAVKLKMGLK